MSPRPVLLAVVSDLHAGGTTAACPNEIRLDDGGEYHASKLQRWLFQGWQQYWVQAAEGAGQLSTFLVLAILP